jgi:hypothetical protein
VRRGREGCRACARGSGASPPLKLRLLLAQRRDVGSERGELGKDALLASRRVRQLRRVPGGLLVEGAHHDADEQVQDHEGREQDEDDEEQPGPGMLRHQRFHDSGRPVVEGHDLEQGVGGGAEISEQLRARRAEQLRGHDREDVEDEEKQEQDRAHPGQRRDEPADHPLQRRHRRDEAQHPQDAQRPQHRERARRRDERDADHDQVEQAPWVAEEVPAEDVNPRREFDDEHRQDRPVESMEQRPVPRHHARARLEA